MLLDHPRNYPTIVRDIPSRRKWIDFIYAKISEGQCRKGPDDSREFMFVPLAVDQIQIDFDELFDALALNRKVRAAYIHVAARGGHMGAHVHSKDFAVYYLQAPPGSGDLVFPEFDIRFPPELARFRFIPGHVLHGIDVHRSEIERIAITMEFQPQAAEAREGV